MKWGYVSIFFFMTKMSLGQTTDINKDFKKMLDGHYKDFPLIQPQDAQEKIGKSSTLFLDTREPEEYNVSHIKGAKLYGYKSPNVTLLKDLPKDTEIIVYCSVGVRSQNTGKDLKKKGFTNVKNLYGGIFLWQNQDRELVDSTNKDTEKLHVYSEKWGKWVTRGEKVY